MKYFRYLWSIIKTLFEYIQKYWKVYGQWRKKLFTGKVLYQRLLLSVGFWMLYILIFLFLVDVNFLWLFGKSPKMSQIRNPEQKIASELYSSDGKLLGKYFDENRSPVTYQEISPNFIKALICTEDVRFYQHHGIDIKATISALWNSLHGEKRGGSTLTQQLVKNLFKTRTQYSKGLLGWIPGLNIAIYKLKEWISALKIELFYSKNDILEMYLNTVDFGSNAYGLKVAAKTFFNTSTQKLSWEQSALLVGMLRAPTYFSPISQPEHAMKRRNVVLNQLFKYEIISREVCDSLCKLPLGLNFNMEENYDGSALYFRDAVASSIKVWLKDNDFNLYEDGLKVYTTIDSKMQEYAEKSLAEHMRKLQCRFSNHWSGSNPWVDNKGNELPGFIEGIISKTNLYAYLKAKYKSQTDSIEHYLRLPYKMKVFDWKSGSKDTLFSAYDSVKYYNSLLNSGLYAVDPQTGFVKAYVGGIDYTYFKFDHVRQSKRQPGSTFKAFLYTAAMDNGYGPCDTMNDIPVSITYTENGVNKSWSPHNADWEFSRENMTLKHAFAKSVNSVAVQLTKRLGWQKVIEYAYRLGINSKLINVPSVCLGSSDVSLFELVNAYCPLVNNGYRISPLLVTKITDKNGKVLFESASNKVKVLKDETSFLMQQMLMGGLTEPGGTTQALYEWDLFRYNMDIGGKTGTSSNHADGWFIAVTPNLVCGSWVGGESRSVHFRTSELGEGCRTALPICGLFLEKVLKDKRFDYLKVRFPKPSVKILKEYSCHTYYSKNDSLQLDTLIKTLE